MGKTRAVCSQNAYIYKCFFKPLNTNFSKSPKSDIFKNLKRPCFFAFYGRSGEGNITIFFHLGLMTNYILAVFQVLMFGSSNGGGLHPFQRLIHLTKFSSRNCLFLQTKTILGYPIHVLVPETVPFSNSRLSRASPKNFLLCHSTYLPNVE